MKPKETLSPNGDASIQLGGDVSTRVSANAKTSVSTKVGTNVATNFKSGVLATVLLASALLIATPIFGVDRADAGGMGPLLLQSGAKVSVVRPDANSAVTFTANRAMSSFDGSFVGSTSVTGQGADGAKTLLEVHDPWTGDLAWKHEIPGEWRIEAISANGAQVVLGDPSISPDAAAVPKGRAVTRLMLVGDGVGLKEFNLPGNFVAEAFMAQGGGIALIEHLPPINPKRYRVRPLMFFGGDQALLKPLGGLKTALKQTLPRPEEMEGQRLNQSWNGAGDSLYTLYDADGYGGNPEGVFVHALDLKTGEARCLDVPSDIAAGKGKGKVLYLDGDKVVVVGTKGIVRMNARTGEVEHKVRVQTKAVGALFAQADALYLSDGRSLLQYQVSTLKKTRSFAFKSAIVAGTIEGQMPPIVLDESGSIWYATASLILRGKFTDRLGRDATVIVRY
jgi:hypothetical protein